MPTTRRSRVNMLSTPMSGANGLTLSSSTSDNEDTILHQGENLSDPSTNTLRSPQDVNFPIIPDIPISKRSVTDFPIACSIVPNVSMSNGCDVGMSVGAEKEPDFRGGITRQVSNMAGKSTGLSSVLGPSNRLGNEVDSGDETTEEELSLRLEEIRLRRRVIAMKKRPKGQGIERGIISNTVETSGSQHASARLDTTALTGSIAPMEALFCGLSLPKLEVESFDGSPGQYFSFMKAFERSVANKVSDEGQKLSYLLHYCKGRAKDCISHCSLLPSERGYIEAMRLLRKQFGQPYLIAQAVRQELLSRPRLRQGDLDGLRRLVACMRTSQLTLSQLGRVSDLDNPSTLVAVMEKLPTPVQERWAETVDGMLSRGQEPIFDDLFEFLERRVSIASSEYGLLASGSSSRAYVTQPMEVVRTRLARCNANVSRNEVPVPNGCTLCHDRHDLLNCPQFLEQSVQDRKNTVRSAKRCFKCLKPNHMARQCNVPTRCSVCGQRHHTLMHQDAPTAEQQEERAVSCSGTTVGVTDVRLGFVPVRLVGRRGAVETYAFIDNGSDTTLIDEKLVKKLGLATRPCRLGIRTMLNTNQVQSAEVQLDMVSVDNGDHIKIERAYSVPSLPITKVGGPEVDAKSWPHLADLTLHALPDKGVGILLGCNVPEAHWVTDQRIGSRRQPYALKSPLGWVLWGPTKRNPNPLAHVNSIGVQELTLREQVACMYEGEFDEDDKNEPYSVEDTEALKIAETTVTIDGGHYSIGLPWRTGVARLRSNAHMATGRLSGLKRRLLRDHKLKAKYFELIASHVDKGYVRRVCSLSESTGDRWFLPHHPVFNPNKPGKVRIVFDCAALYDGRSLNLSLLQGPDLTNRLTGVLLRFREHPIAVSADIEEMFLQVRVPVQDRWALSFLWWDTKELQDPPAIYEMSVHPFGATSSPFCANYALRRTAADNEPYFHGETAMAVRENFYVDDLLLSVSSVEEAARTVMELRSMLAKGGFRLVKWISTHPEVLRDVAQGDKLSGPAIRDITDGRTQRALGVQWDLESDSFKFDVGLPDRAPTRRGILSCVASFYDPMGYVAPMLLPARRLLQELCSDHSGWDSGIGVDREARWNHWLKEMKSVKELKVPRCLIPVGLNVQKFELHMFADASETGYGAVGYLRMTATNGTVDCRFLLGKSRVAPNKAITIPRLELVAAVLAVKLMRQLLKEIRLTVASVSLWTDSTITLQYITSTTTRFATFVANRVAFIRKFTKIPQWRHVPSEHNPADVASRGASRFASRELTLWLEGPQFLRAREDRWPELPKLDGSLPAEAEVRASKITCAISVGEGLNGLLCRYSSFLRLSRAAAWLTRFKKYLSVRRRTRSSTSSGRLTANEVRLAGRDVLRIVQSQSFSEELKHLHRYEIGVSLKSADLRRLNPVLVDGLLCLGGRSDKLVGSDADTHLIILPSRHPVTDAIVRDHHEKEGHMGVTHTLGSLRLNYWVVKGAASVKRVISKCISCRARSARSGSQIMAPLPESRTRVGCHPFASTGVDYFGPIIVRDGRRSKKRFGCLFTCLTMRAVHLEVAHELTTDSFIMAFTRFVGRRGVPEEMYSDNGTNFVGAEAELRSAIQALDKDRISGVMTRYNIQWHFNPPACSHRGGIWERLIRSIKRILSAVAREQSLTDETLLTYLIDTERIMNNRPLVPVYDDPANPTAFTPNDLLLRRSCEGLCAEEVSLRHRYTRGWRQSQLLVDTFWKRWTSEYYPTLQLRHKWMRPQRDFKVGDLVLIIGEGRAKGDWQKGVIRQAVQSSDGHVRKVVVASPRGNLTKDIRRICLLEGEGEQ